jgi:succinate-semialdehyde dehydrogenase / glutarate-semialdehyde dehydrogenase
MTGERGAAAALPSSLPAAESSPLGASRAGPPVRARGLIGGRWLDRDEPPHFEVTCRTTGAVLASVPAAGRAEARAAIEASAQAFRQWSRSSVDERSRLLRDAARLLVERRDQLARLIALESGKPLTEARAEVGYAAGFLEFFAAEATRRTWREEREGAPGKSAYTVTRPVGPAGLIAVWNFPAAGITRPLGAALAAGCTAVVKPAEKTPLSAVAVFEALCEAGLPAGAANLVLADDPAPVAKELLAAAAIRKLSFTGSAEPGKRLLAGAAAGMKRVTLELGGSAPFIVFPDADLDAAVDGAVRSKFRNAGQTCVCADRIFVHRDLLQVFSRRFADRAQALRIGDPLDEETEIGPLVDAAAAARLEKQVADALARGATIIAGSERARRAEPGGGHYFEPTVLTGVSEQMLVMREETFGPVAPIASFGSEAEVLEAANRLPWGLAAFCYTADPERAVRLSSQLEYGIIGVNDPLPAAPGLPFGGVKQSGIGKEGGPEGLDEFLETQLVSVGS